MSNERRKNPRAVLACAITVIALLPLFAPAASWADAPDISVPSWAQRYFSPNGDGNEDAAGISFCLSDPANVTIRVIDSAGRSVRTLEDDVSHPANPGCGWPSNSVTWDGTDGLGSPVDGGVYTVDLHAVFASGETSDASVKLGVDNRKPGTLASPAPGDVLSGGVSWKFVPTAGFSVSSVSIGCSGFGGSSSPSADADGAFTGSLDTAACSDGANTLSANVSWTDPFGSSHGWAPPPVSVTIDNPPRLTPSWWWTKAYFSPNGDGQEDSTTLPFCLSENAKVDAAVVDDTGATVRTIQTATDTPGSAFACQSGFFNSYVTWDGLDDSGSPVADGVYKVKLHAVDATGNGADTSFDVGVDKRLPGTLIHPSLDAVLSGEVAWDFKSTPGLDVSSASVGCSGSASSTDSTPDSDGSFRGTLDSTSCSDGANTASLSAIWTDPFGVTHGWSTSTAVTVDNPPALSIPSFAHRYFSPDGDGQDDSTNISFCLSKDAKLDVTVADQAGKVIRTIETGRDVSGARQNCGWWGYNNTWLWWDGRDDSGAAVADGVYTLRLHAVDASGKSGDTSVDLGVDNRTPGILMHPSAGDRLAGDIAWKFVPTPGFPISSLSVSCAGAASSSTTPDSDGSFTGTLDSRACTDGANTITAYAAWTDPFGSGHGWSGPSLAVIADNPPQLSLWVGSSKRYFSPNGDGQEDTATVPFCLTKNATVDATVVDHVGVTVRTIEHESDHTGSTSCLTNGSVNNSVTWDGLDDAGKPVADGAYALELHAADGAGKTSDATIELGVDKREPGELTRPSSGDTLAGLARLAFKPTAGFRVDRVDLGLDTGGGASIYNASPDGTWRTSVYTGSLNGGPARLSSYVQYTDPFGVSHTWVAPVTPVAIDVTSLPLSLTADSTSGQAPLATTLHVDTSDPQARSLHYAVDFGDGARTEGDVSPPYSTIGLDHTYEAPGAYRAIVTVTNGAGGAASRSLDIAASAKPNAAPTSDLSLDSSAGAAPFAVAASVSGSDADGDPLTYTLDFGDGSTASGPLPRGDAVPHSYTRAGSYVLRLAVSDGKATTVKTTHVQVALPEPLAARAGDDQAAATDTPVHFDGNGSRPSAGIEDYRWTFGDGSSADGATAEHQYTAPGTYTVTLTVQAAGHVQTDSAKVTVARPQNAGGLAATVKDDGGSPLAGVDLVVVDSSGVKYSATTDGSGVGRIQNLPDGSYTVYAWRAGYLPGTVTATVADHRGAAALTLKLGPVATSSLTSKPMTRDEITAAGIDPNDPDNQHVYQFEIHLAFDGTDVIKGYVGGDANGGPGWFPRGISGSEDVSCTAVCIYGHGAYHAVMSVQWVSGSPQILWLIIPGKAKWLKEFFNVQMMVTNLADRGFVLDHGQATLPLPGGLSLAPTAQPESDTVAMPDIPGGESRTASWVVRGDVEGRYPLTASYSGVLEPFGAPVNLDATTQTDLHVWGGSALKLMVDTDDAVQERYPYHTTVGLKNVADVPVYNVSLALLEEGKLNYIYQPRERLERTADTLNPGESLSGDFILVPKITGTLDLARSFVKKTAGDVTLADSITSHPAPAPASVPKLTATGQDNAVALHWDAIPGATSYQVFRTPDQDTQFPSEPLTETSATSATITGVPNGAPAQWYAVSAVVGGRNVMYHPMVQQAAAAPDNNGGDGKGTPNASCDRSGLTIGVVAICADRVASDGKSVSGRVLLDGGVSVGDGPIHIDPSAKTITGDFGTPLVVKRSGGDIGLGTTGFEIDAQGTTDDISGRSGVAAVHPSAPLGPLAGLKVAGLSIDASSPVKLFLDSQEGGGMVAGVRLTLNIFAPETSKDYVGVGIYANSGLPVKPLGGKVTFPSFKVKDWGFDGLSLEYHSGSNTWAATGGVKIPKLIDLSGEGRVVDGTIDALHLSVGGLTVPLGDTGFFFDSFGGGFAGLAGFANGTDSLKISASTSGFWGVPKAPVEPLYLDNATFTIDTAKKASFDGAVTFALKDHSPITGSLHLAIDLSNGFRAEGGLGAKADVAGIKFDANNRVKFTTKHFTASGTADLDLRGGFTGRGSGVVSDVGAGGSGRLCWHHVCENLSFAMRWDDLKGLSGFHLPHFNWIGGDPTSVITVHKPLLAKAAAGGHGFTVPKGRRLLFFDSADVAGAPAFSLVAPDGTVYSSAHPGAHALVSSDSEHHVTTLTVIGPKPGRWTVRGLPATAESQGQTIRPVRSVSGKVSVVTSKRHRLPRKTRVVPVSWTSAGLPRSTRVALYTSPRAGEAGTLVRDSLRAKGKLRVPVGRLLRGANHLHLVVTVGGVGVADAAIPRVVWK